MRRRNSLFGLVLAAFGLGVLLECCFPSSFLVCVIAVAIVIVGLLLCKS